MPTIGSNGTRPRTPREWQGVFRDWEASGLTQVEFCEDRGLSVHVFRAQRYARRKSRGTPEAGRTGRATFVPVRVVAKSSGSSLALLNPGVAVLELVLVGGRVVRVPSGFDESVLARVIAVVEGRTC